MTTVTDQGALNTPTRSPKRTSGISGQLDHAVQDEDVTSPTEVDAELGVFDRFAGAAATWASRAPFFAFSVLLVVLWLVEGAIRVAASGKPNSFLDQTYQLQINTLTTIVTFLLVALLQNTQTRSDAAVQHKLNAIADGLADLMARTAERSQNEQLHRDLMELRAAVGLENREGTTQS